MTDQELRDLIDSVAALQAETARQLQQSAQETDRKIRETDRKMRENDREMQKTAQQMRETDRRLRELGKQIGGLGDKFGSFTEGMAFPAMTKILEEQFGIDNISLRHCVKRDGRFFETDVLGYTEGERNLAVVVEVKSHLREEGVEQMLRILRDFHEWMPLHRDKKLYGILAFVDAPEDLRRRVLKEGVFLAQISGDSFELQVPEGFVPRSFQVN